MTLQADFAAGKDEAIPTVADLLRLYDWSSSSLGEQADWPQSLRTVIDTMMASGHAMCLTWGPEQTFFYNESYAPVLGTKHPRALGRPIAEVWSDVWSDIEPIVVRTLLGETQTFRDMPLVTTRHGYPEETFWTFSYSPVRDEAGEVAGLLNVTSETTARVTAERERDVALDRLRSSQALARENVERVQLALAAGAIIGTWNWDLTRDFITIDESFAKAFGLDTAVGRQGVPVEQILATVHPDEKASVETAIADVIARGGTYAFQYRTRRSDGNYYWLEANGQVKHGPDGTPLSFAGVLIDVEERRAVESERDRAASKLRESEQFLRSVLASSNDCIKVLDLDAKLIFMSEGGQAVMEVSDFNAIAGCPWPDFWHGEGNVAAREAIAAAQAGRAAHFQGYAETFKGNRRYWDVQVSPILDADGKPERILSVSRDVTVLKEAEEMRTVLAQELAHRMKNTLAMVQAIATQTLRQATSMEEGRNALSHRLGALARAQDILIHSVVAEADVRQVVAAALAPHQTEERRIRVEGEHFVLTSQQALGLSLAIHELATNAVKYGALSNSDGTVQVSWNVVDGAFVFDWIETGGPTVVAPERRGFGSRLIERIVASYFDGEGRIDFHPTGIRFKLTGASLRPDPTA